MIRNIFKKALTYLSVVEKEQKITFMVAVFMFLSEMRPFEPYRSAYLTGPDGNISLSEVADVIESIKQYSALIVGILMLITADYLLYKPNILFLTAWDSLSFLFMTCSPSVTRLRVSMVGAGAFCNTNILMYGYLYAQIKDPSQFQMATGIVTAAVQLGRVAGGLMAQYIVNATEGVYTSLPYVTALILFLAFIWSIFFPPVKQEKQFSSKQITSNEKSWLLERSTENIACYTNNSKIGQNKRSMEIKNTLKKMWTNFKISYSNPIVLKRSIWYVFGMAAYVEILTYINVLYSYVIEKSNNQNVSSNGMAEAMVTLSGAAGAYLTGRLRLDWTYYGDLFTAFCSTLMGFLIILMYYYSRIYFVYISYILFGFVCQAQFVVVYSEIAKRLEKQCYIVVLEFNFIGSMILDNITTFFLVQINFMHITIPGRFLFFGGCFIMLGIVFLLINIIELFGKRKTLH